MARKPSSIPERKSMTRNPKPKVLIVCEGKETEPQYFNLIKQKYHLRSVVVVKQSTLGSAPISVAQSAVNLNQEQIDLYGPSAEYEKVFCVYDTDKHTSLAEAKQLIDEHNFIAVISNICFEYWFILHYKYSRAPFLPKSGRSASRVCVKKLKEYIPDYEKSGVEKYFNDLYCRLETAITNSERSLKDAESTHEFNPSTNVHALVLFLQSLR